MIHVGDSVRYLHRPLVESLLEMVFALAARDRATWLRFDYHPDRSDVRMSYYVPPTVHELVPPPRQLWPDLVHYLLRHARLPRADRLPWWRWVRQSAPFPARPVFGILPVQFGDVVHELDVLFFRGRTGEHIWVETRYPLPSAGDFLRRRLRP